MNVIPHEVFRGFRNVRDTAKRKNFRHSEAMKLARDALKQGENPAIVAYEIGLMQPRKPRGDVA